MNGGPLSAGCEDDRRMAIARGWQRILVAVFGLLPALLLCLAFVPSMVRSLWGGPGQAGIWAVPSFIVGVTLVWGTFALLRVVAGGPVDAARHGLAAGIIGSLVLSAMMAISRSLLGFAILLFALGPLLVFVVLYAQAAIQRGRHYAPATLCRFALGLALAVAAIAAAPSAVVWWYGRDFNEKAADAAAAVAPDGEYCIFDDDRGVLVSGFDELDRDKMLRRALYSSLRHSRADASRWREHHFRLVVDEETYYWSFGEAAFKFEGRSGFQLRDTLSELCGNYLSYPELYSSALGTRAEGIEISRANFCCPSVGAAEITL